MADLQEQALARGIHAVYSEDQDKALAEANAIFETIDPESAAKMTLDQENGSFTIQPGSGADPEWQGTFRVTVRREV